MVVPTDVGVCDTHSPATGRRCSVGTCGRVVGMLACLDIQQYRNHAAWDWRGLTERIWAFQGTGGGAARARQCPLRGEHEVQWERSTKLTALIRTGWVGLLACPAVPSPQGEKPMAAAGGRGGLCPLPSPWPQQVGCKGQGT